jgi:hypothetical protein
MRDLREERFPETPPPDQQSGRKGIFDVGESASSPEEHVPANKLTENTSISDSFPVLSETNDEASVLPYNIQSPASTPELLDPPTPQRQIEMASDIPVWDSDDTRSSPRTPRARDDLDLTDDIPVWDPDETPPRKDIAVTRRASSRSAVSAYQLHLRSIFEGFRKEAGSSGAIGTTAEAVLSGSEDLEGGGEGRESGGKSDLGM